MHQEAYQDAGHCHQDRVVVHTLQAYREGRKMEHSCSSVAGASGRLLSLVFLHKGKLRPGLHSMAVLALLLLACKLRPWCAAVQGIEILTRKP